MQTFLPYPDFAKSAACLDNKRLGKQRVECLQMLTTLSIGPTQWFVADLGWQSEYRSAQERKTPWYNHPVVRMWNKHKHALALYGCHCAYEWRKRGFKDTCSKKICELMLWTNNLEIELRKIEYDAKYPKFDYPGWLGNEAFHASHRSNLLRKDPVYYGQFGWTETNNLPYIWPV